MFGAHIGESAQLGAPGVGVVEVAVRDLLAVGAPCRIADHQFLREPDAAVGSRHDVVMPVAHQVHARPVDLLQLRPDLRDTASVADRS